MVSRRKILSRSRDDLNLDQTFSPQEEEEDIWYQKDKLYKEHIQEVLDKWTQIDDEIWAKVIVFERNRRVAKAYARAPVLTINGSDDGFDGMRIGLCGFDNPMRDQKTEELKKHIGQGVKIKMDDAGNILIRRYAKSNVYIKSTASSQNEETSIGADILKLPNQALESEKIVKLFDMKKFQSNVNRELRRAYPDRRRLETQCLSAVAFVKSESDILECPIWVLIVNVVAMDMLKSKLPPVQRPIVDIKNRPRIPIPDEDPYSVAGNGSGGSSGSSGFGASAMSSMMSLQQQQQLLQQQQQQAQSMTSNNSNNSHNNNNSTGITTNGIAGSGNNTLQHLNNGMVAGINGNGHVAAAREQLIMQTQQLAHKRSEKPPKLPPRDNIYGHDIPKPDYDDINVDTRIKLSRGKSDKGKDNKKYDDPYYCGLRARVPNFVKTSSKSGKEQPALQNGLAAQQQQHMNTLTNQKKTSVMMAMHPVLHAPQPPHMHPHHIQQQQMMAAVAAHAAAQQQHPMHHHHVQHAAAAAAQQMWQTRSYESGIGIYNHNATTTTTTAAAATSAATATNFNTDLQLQHHHHLQQQQQQLQHQQQQLQTASSNYYPSTNASSSFYNYLAPNYQEHIHQQQQQQLANSSSTPSKSLTTTTTTTPLSSASNLMPTTQSLTPIGQHMTNTSNAIAPSASIQLSTNLTFATTSPPLETTKTNHESLYGQTRNLNFKQVNNTPLVPPPHSSLHNQQFNYHNHNQNQHHRHHSHHSHHQHQHRRSHHHGSYYGCSMHSSQLPSKRFTPVEFHLRPQEPIYNDFPNRRSKHFRPSRRSSSANTSIDNNCNCVSCYTLAPLFGAPTPKRPPRSLSQQQLRQHQRLSGAKNLYNNELRRGGGSRIAKWCSDSDVSLLGREDQEQSEGTDNYNAYANRSAYYDNDSVNNIDDDFNLDQDFDIENFSLTQMDYKKQIQKPNAPKFNGYAARHKYSTTNDTQHSLTDDYVDRIRSRQLRSPTPQRQGTTQLKEAKPRTPVKKRSTNLLAMRNKSQSTESFFEQPHEEGTIYLYGGRKRIIKAPSTTNLYDRIKNQRQLNNNSQAKKYNSQLNLHNDRRQVFLTNKESNDHDTLKPLLPPPLWRGAKRMNLKVLSNQKLNTYQFLDHNNNEIAANRQDNKNNHHHQNREKTNKATSTNQNNNSNSDGNGNGNKTFNKQYNSAIIKTGQFYGDSYDSNKRKRGENDKTQQQQQQQAHSQTQTQQNYMEKQQQQPQMRIARSSSRVDLCDMDSIYGYLKPRKPRSLSMKKIQILDY